MKTHGFKLCVRSIAGNYNCSTIKYIQLPATLPSILRSFHNGKVEISNVHCIKGAWVIWEMFTSPLFTPQNGLLLVILDSKFWSKRQWDVNPAGKLRKGGHLSLFMWFKRKRSAVLVIMGENRCSMQFFRSMWFTGNGEQLLWGIPAAKQQNDQGSQAKSLILKGNC